MQSELQKTNEKYQRLARLENAERQAVARWQREIEAAEQRRIYSYLTEERQVKYLVHFTPMANLQSILRYGILPRTEIERRGIDAVTPDVARYDFQTSYSSLSISFPNYRMLFSKKNNTKCDYVILLIDPAIILTVPLTSISYLPHNAASKYIENVKSYTGEKSVKALFHNTTLGDCKYDRVVLDIPLSYTTNPQAEVFIKGVIPANYICAVVTERQDQAIKLREEISAWTSCVKPRIIQDSYYFRARSDYQFWRSLPEEDG